MVGTYYTVHPYRAFWYILDNNVFEGIPTAGEIIQALRTPAVGTMEFVDTTDPRLGVCGLIGGHSLSGKPHYVGKAHCGFTDSITGGFYEPDGDCSSVEIPCAGYICSSEASQNVLVLYGNMFYSYILIMAQILCFFNGSILYIIILGVYKGS